MFKFALSGALAAVLFLVPSMSRAQDSDDVANLRKQLELLKKENELLKQENALLKKENELLKQEAKAKRGGAQDTKETTSLPELLSEGTVLQGPFRNAQGEGTGDVTLTISERDGNKFKGRLLIVHKEKFVKVGTTEGEVEGVISGNRMSLSTVGTANKINASLLLRSGALEGTYKQQSGDSGTIGLRVSK